MRHLTTAEEQLIMFMEITDKQKVKIAELENRLKEEEKLFENLAEEANELSKEVNRLDKVIEKLEKESRK